ncbi:MAG: hypothetical protein IPO17_14930 [Flavobacteriales bacterium]|nr:hypothetical protein [Flavobacteriales bacterium]
MLSSLFSRPANPEERLIRAWSRSTLGLTPGDLALYRQALRHSSAVPEDRPDLPNNERLEFLGDAILDAIVGTLLFRTYPDKSEGFLTRMRSKLVSRTSSTCWPNTSRSKKWWRRKWRAATRPVCRAMRWRR